MLHIGKGDDAFVHVNIQQLYKKADDVRSWKEVKAILETGSVAYPVECTVIDGETLRLKIQPNKLPLGKYGLRIDFVGRDDVHKTYFRDRQINIVKATDDTDLPYGTEEGMDVYELGTMAMYVPEKGDPFLYEDFTPEQIEELKKPARDAAEVANAAASNANDKAAAAEAAKEAAIASKEAAYRATEAANAAAQAAEDAKAVADAAKTAASDAASVAARAEGLANNAVSQANSANQIAMTASTKADSAATAAQNAGTAAAAADTKAEAAKTAAEQAKQTAQNADQKVTDFSSEVGELGNLVTPTKTDLVSAVNEAYNHGGGGGGLTPEQETNVAKIPALNTKVSELEGKVNPLKSQVDSNTQAIEGIAASGGASVASAVIFNDGKNAEQKHDYLLSKIFELKEGIDVNEDGLFFVDSNLNIGAKITQEGFFCFNVINIK